MMWHFRRRHLSRSLMRVMGAVMVFTLWGITASPAQRAVPEGTGDALTHVQLLTPPAMGTIAVYLFEDLACPTCARFYPYVREAVKRYRVPLIRYDYPLPNHPWAFDAAVASRYLHDVAGPDVAEEYRRDVFLEQWKIDSRDDLSQFTRRWLSSRKLPLPDVMDASGALARRVRADIDLGNRIGLTRTPTLLVVTAAGWIQVTNAKALADVLEQLHSEKVPGLKSQGLHE